MKKQVRKFISNYFIKIITYTSMVFVYTVDSMIALTFYSIAVHTLSITFYGSSYIDWELQPYKFPSCGRFVLAFLESIIFLMILGITEHWYTFIITGIYSFFLIINIYDLVFHKEVQGRLGRKNI